MPRRASARGILIILDVKIARESTNSFDPEKQHYKWKPDSEEQQRSKEQANGGQLKHKCVIFLFFCFFLCADYLVCLFVCVCITMRVLLANKWATLQAACLYCAKLALHHGTSIWATIHCQGGMLKDATTGFVSIQTVCFVLQVDLYRAWIQLYMFWAGL